MLSLFDKVYYINSKNRPDRFRNMSARFEALGYQKDGLNFGNGHIERFEAIFGGHIASVDFGDQKKKLNNGEIGCFLSHREIWKKIKESGYKKTLILEDDAEFGKDFDSFNDLFNSVPDFDLLYLGQWNYDVDFMDGQKIQGKETSALIEEISPRIWKANRCWLTHAYVVDLNCIDYLLKSTEKLYSCLDHVMADIQSELKVYAIYPSIVKQDLTKSSIR